LFGTGVGNNEWREKKRDVASTVWGFWNPDTNLSEGFTDKWGREPFEKPTKKKKENPPKHQPKNHTKPPKKKKTPTTKTTKTPTPPHPHAPPNQPPQQKTPTSTPQHHKTRRNPFCLNRGQAKNARNDWGPFKLAAGVYGVAVGENVKIEPFHSLPRPLDEEDA